MQSHKGRGYQSPRRERRFGGYCKWWWRQWSRRGTALDTRGDRQRPIPNRHQVSWTKSKRKPTNERQRRGKMKRANSKNEENIQIEQARTGAASEQHNGRHRNFEDVGFKRQRVEWIVNTPPAETWDHLSSLPSQTPKSNLHSSYQGFYMMNDIL